MLQAASRCRLATLALLIAATADLCGTPLAAQQVVPYQAHQVASLSDGLIWLWQALFGSSPGTPQTPPLSSLSPDAGGTLDPDG